MESFEPIRDDESNTIRQLFQTKLGDEIFTSGFHTMRVLMRSPAVAEIQLPTESLRLRLKKHYLAELHECIQTVRPSVKSVTVECARSQLAAKPSPPAPEELPKTVPKRRDNTVILPLFSTADWYSWLESMGVQIPRQITLDLILRTICTQLRIEKEDLLAQTRRSEIARARQIGLYLARKHTTLSKTQIAKGLRKDQATVVHSLHRIEALRNSDDSVRKALSAIEHALGVSDK